MPTVNDDILNEAIKHQIEVQQMIRTLNEEYQSTLDDADSQIIDELDNYATDIASGNTNSLHIGLLLGAILVANRDAHSEMNSDFRSQVSDFLQYEADFQANLIRESLPFDADISVPDADVLENNFFDTPILGRDFDQWLDDFESSRYSRDEMAIKRGMVGGEDAEEIAGDLEDSVFPIGERQLVNLTRTLFNSAANSARRDVVDENPDIAGAVQWHATLDEVTCAICADLDGQVFDSEDEAPEEMPAHPSCRCFFVPVVQSATKMGVHHLLSPEHRSRLRGQPSQKMRYDAWLRKQNAATQDEALGPSRGRLFRLGKLPVTKFTDSRHRRLTLSELKSRNPAAFRKAKI
jgi:SPP1 gp7 family putative phage head morphogenesis protein